MRFVFGFSVYSVILDVITIQKRTVYRSIYSIYDKYMDIYEQEMELDEAAARARPTFHIRHFCWLTNHFVQSMPGHEASIARMLNQANAILSRTATFHRTIRADVSKECLQSGKLRIESIVRATTIPNARGHYSRARFLSI